MDSEGRKIMDGFNQFFDALGLKDNNKALSEFSKKTGIPVKRLKYYNATNTLPSGNDLETLEKHVGISIIKLMFKMGHFDNRIIEAMRLKSEEIYNLIINLVKSSEPYDNIDKFSFETKLGRLYQGDCLSLLRTIESDSIDMVFADPPFNLNKIYPSRIDDNLKERNYISWCETWIIECARVLKHGGSLFLWNLPVWNSKLSRFIHSLLNFKHWIAVDIKYTLPFPGRLYPSHYSLLYFVKGNRPNTFTPDRLPMLTCPKCYADLKDYGGYKDKMNPNGVNLTDIWYDIPPVRHSKYKKRRYSNELSIKLLDRIIELSTKKGDLILDPFGGSGTTFIVAEIKDRRWIGSEIGPIDSIIERFKFIEEERRYIKNIRSNYNVLFPEKVRNARERLGLWTSESVRNKDWKISKR